MHNNVPLATLVSVSDLRLWDRNPRILQSMEGQSQLAIARLINDEFDPIEVGRSISSTGWDATSVLSVTGEGVPVGTYLVVEGNRRLCALLALADSSIREGLSNPEEWEKVAAKAAQEGLVPTSIPCVVFPTLREAKLQLGSRHFLGIKQWLPYQKDRFILENIDAGDPIEEVAGSFGFDVAEVRKSVLVYRVFEALPQRSYGRLDESNYGNLRELILKYGAVRSHMGLPEGKSVDESFAGPHLESDRQVTETLTWVFGTSPDRGGDPDEGRKVKETREYRVLNKIIQSDRGIEALREPHTKLDEALAIVEAEGKESAVLLQDNAEALLESLVKIRKVYQDEGSDAVSESAKRALAEAAALLGEGEKDWGFWFNGSQ